jgi:hypothetical protein
MKTHVDNVHFHLLSKKKIVLNERAEAKLFKIDHNWQHGKKKVTAIGSTIISFFGSINPYKNINETQEKLIEDLVLYICKGYMPISTCENI